MPPAVIAGGIAAVGTIGGALIGSHSANSAAGQAADAQAAATQAQLQLGRESMALNKDIYNSNYDVLSPFVSRGNEAGDQINALLGLGSAPVLHSPLAGQPSGTVPAHPMGGPDSPSPHDTWRTPHTPNGLAHGPNIYHPLNPGAQQPPASQPVPQVDPAIAAQNAFNTFANSAGIKFQQQQGANAVNHLYAGRGALESGAALKGIADYTRNMSLHDYFMPYLGLLGGQQGVGAGAASSIAGVGSNFGNTAANINNAMGGNIQNGANAASNAALVRGQNNASMWNSIGGALGNFASSFIH